MKISCAVFAPSPQRRWSSTFRWAPFVIAVAGLILAIPATSAAEAITVTGITEPFQDVTLSASVPGIIMARKVQEGDFVKDGQVLFELDRRLEELEVNRRRVVRDQKKTDYEGTLKLFNSTRGISKEDLDKKEVEYRVAVVEHDMAEEQLRRRQLVAPLSGIVTAVLLQTGESCSAYQGLIRVVDSRRCYFVANVEARLAANLKVGQTLRVEVDAHPAPVTVEARVNFLSPIVDPASGLRRIKLIFENPDSRVVPGVAGRVNLE